MTNKLLVVSAVAGVLMIVFGALTYISGSGKPPPVANQSALVRPYSPTFGDASAKVHIVEFFDPACETCRSFYPFVKEMIAANPGRIRLSIRYAPFHQGSDQIVKVLEASRKQGKYWQTLEAVLAAQPQWTVNHTARLELAWKAIEGVGLRMQQLKEDMNSPEIAGEIRQDLQDAVALNVTQTPEFFVNGRPMPSFGYEQLKTLVDDALREAYR
ncbi:MAG: disulfide bond formation protein DsbA [Betaproteobacteria bacterium]|nr:MAG: disulfide bond formation protein DsbA [Betaproteobacteria bacterium]